ncbi:MAG: sigma 54-interacting transcriptional regulator [Bacillota bacterium]
MEHKLLFVGEYNSCRSQMAEGFARLLTPPGVCVMSAGVHKGVIDPLAVRSMAEAGVDISGHTVKKLSDLGVQLFDVVIVLSDRIRERYPVLQGIHGLVYWNLPDPSKEENEAERYRFLCSLREEIKDRVVQLFHHGYFSALVTLKNNAERILDNLKEGIVAHDVFRRIFFFNKAAEEITGYRREEVLGRDCHRVFPYGFCGGKCSFQETGTCVVDGPVAYPLDIATKDGETRHLEMSVVPMKDSAGRAVGILASYRDQTRVIELEHRLGETTQFSGIIGRDHKMLEVFETIRNVAATNVPVLIQGETGTGKELVATAIHRESLRAAKPFLVVNCGALPEGTLESELFGHVKGAFTGAIRDKKGRFELANGGTLFLDEVGELSPATQVKLLRVLQEGTFERVGGEKTIKVDIRVISATNRDLREMAAQGKFREDLYYRLCVVPITLPPLRERRTDIPLLAEHFLKRYASQAGGRHFSLSGPALSALLDYDWPGNIRQLQNAIQFAMVKCRDGEIGLEHLPSEITAKYRNLLKGPLRGERPSGAAPTLKTKLRTEDVAKALKETGGNKVKAAKVLGVGRATLYRFLAKNKFSDQ